MSRMIRVLGFGMGPQHVTPEVAEALRSVDYVLAVEKGRDDGQLAIRKAVCDRFGVELHVVVDPPRDRNDPADYPKAVRAWHEARVEAFEQVLRRRGGNAGFLVWGDPSLYDSTIRIVTRLAERLGGLEWDVLPGVSAPSLLAARHRIVLHEVGRPVHITTARRVHADIASGQTNLVVMLGSALNLQGLENWSIWWGANLGDPSEELAAGRVGDVLDEIEAARVRAKAAAGWVMDIYLLRAP